MPEQKENKSKGSEAASKARAKREEEEKRSAKAKPSAREEEEREEDKDEDEDEEAESGDEDEEAEEGDDDAEDSDAEDSDDDEEEDEEDEASKGERDESTKGVAKALGVDSDEEDEEEEAAKEPDTALNRAQRRREEALKRRQAREGGGKKAAAAPSDDESVEATETDSKLPRDKNARAKELLKRRQESASGKRVTKLETAEIVQDSLVRASAASGRFLKNNWKIITTVLVLGLGGAIGFFLWQDHQESASAKRSDALDKGLLASRGHISTKDMRSEDDKKFDPTPVYTTLEARADAQLAAYGKVVSEFSGSGPAILARLGEGTALLDKAKWDEAISAFNEVAGSELAKADQDVKGRSIEGVGFAKEGKGDFDGAIASFKELEALGVKGFDDLGKYHQARMILKKGQTDDAKTMFVELQKKLEVPSADGGESAYVKSATDEYLKAIDPTLVKKKSNIGGMRGNTLTPDDLKDLDEEKMRRLQEMLQHAAEHGDEGPPQPGDLP